MQSVDPKRSGAARSPLAGGGEMGALMREVDWSCTPVGPSEGWPQSLRTAVSIVLESKFGMMIAWGPELTQFYNDPFRPILGATKHPACGKSARDTFPEAWHIIGPLFEQVMAGHSVGFEDMLVPLDRNGYLEECYFLYSYSPIRDESGGVGGIHVTVNETTARVIAERRLRTLRDLAALAGQASREEDAWTGAGRVLAQSLADVPFALLYVVDAGGSTARLMCSHGDAALAAGHVPLSAGVWPLDIRASAGDLRVLDDVRERFGDRFGSAWPEPVRQAVVLPVTRPGLAQPYGFLVAGVSPRRELDDRYRDFLSLVADQVSTAVANIRAFDEERKRAEALAALDRDKTAFFSNISHEFRTPLTLMLAPLEDALGREATLLAGADLGVVHRNARRLLKLVNTLLEFSRIEAGRTQARFLPVDVSALTSALASSFGSLFSQAGLALRVSCSPLPEPAYVDSEMWEKIVLNLVSNAFKFTFEGSIEVSLEARDGCMALSVVDTGTGIPEGDVPFIFERFRRVEGARGRSHEGSGIGLALVSELVRMHGGRIEVESELGVGSRFSVTIPLGAAHLPPERVGSASANVPVSGVAAAYVDEALGWHAGTGESSRAGSDGPNGAARASRQGDIVLAEDNADMREYVRKLLVAEGWSVEAVEDGQAALEAVSRRLPDLVVADVMMPRLDGIGLLRSLKEQPPTRAVPVILLSARAGNEAAIEGLALGADDYVVKPFSAKELVSRVATRLEVSRARSDAARALGDLRLADQRKDEFLATLAHELRNPMSAISSALALLEQGGSDEASAARYREVARRQMTNLVRLVDDLLDVARITRGKVDLRKSGVDIAAVVEHAVASARPLIEAREHLLEVRIEPGSFPMQADATRLEQIIVNLLNNAAKYTTPGGRIAVELRRAPTAEQALVTVRDSGRGIPRHMLEQVFDLFTQVSPTIDRSTGGLGLGLTLCKHLTEMHGGNIWAASEGPGQGSEFTLRLPLDLAVEVRPSAHSIPGVARTVRRRRILIVEDSEDARQLLEEYLEALGHEVFVAADGAQGVALVAEVRPDVALIDLGLPTIDGYEVARRIRAQPEGRQTFLAALTGYGGESITQQTRAAGFDIHLTKPVEMSALSALLDAPPAR